MHASYFGLIYRKYTYVVDIGPFFVGVSESRPLRGTLEKATAL